MKEDKEERKMCFLSMLLELTVPLVVIKNNKWILILLMRVNMTKSNLPSTDNASGADGGSSISSMGSAESSVSLLTGLMRTFVTLRRRLWKYQHSCRYTEEFYYLMDS